MASCIRHCGLKSLFQCCTFLCSVNRVWSETLSFPCGSTGLFFMKLFELYFMAAGNQRKSHFSFSLLPIRYHPALHSSVPGETAYPMNVKRTIVTAKLYFCSSFIPGLIFALLFNKSPADSVCCAMKQLKWLTFRNIYFLFSI